jgi:hypothetical protein
MRCDKHTVSSAMLALSIVAVYVTLSVAAVTCVPDVGRPASPHHHQGHDHHGVSHTSLCAWSCQANSSVALAPSGTGNFFLLTLLSTVALVHLLGPQNQSATIRPRSPPYR